MSTAETTDCENEFPDHYKVMMDRLNEQRKLDQFTDITLIVDGHQFRAHKAVLAACSQFFYKFFQDFKMEPLVEIEGVSNMAFRHLIEFTYTATLAVNGHEEINDVWKAAEYLQMQEAIKALKSRIKAGSPVSTTKGPIQKSKAKKRKIAETSNVITETLPSVETEPVEIEVEISGGTIDVEERIEVLAEVAEPVKEAENSQGNSDDSALALLADITSKYQQGEQNLQAAKKDEIQTVSENQEETDVVSPPKAVESIEVVEVQISQLNNVFHCDKCDRSFKLYYHYKQHLKLHSDKAYVCPHCSKIYSRESALKHHVTCNHFDVEQARRHRPQKKVHVCAYCEKQFDHFGHFKEHLRKHTGEKPFECPNCHERFARNSTLKCHLAACQNGAGAKKGRKKLYECQVCSSVFNSWEQFKDHLVIHTGEKPNHCTICDLWFTQPSDMRTHLRDCHNIHERVLTEVILQDHVTTDETAEALLEDVRVEHLTVEEVHIDPSQVVEAVQVHVDPVEVEQRKDQHIQDNEEKSAEAEGREVTDGQTTEAQVEEHIEIGSEQVSDSTVPHYLEHTVQEVEMEHEQVEIHVEETEVIQEEEV
ncbi:ZN131 protein, partial [Polypterus senegalus]